MWTNYCQMIISLPDVNIWIALAAEGHVHHVPAREWLTNYNVMGRAPRTIVQAWEIFGQLRADRRLAFASEPDRLEFVWRQLMTRAGVGPSSWTDAYLAVFAEANSYSLVTFDSEFERWPALNLTLLPSVQNRPGK